VKQVEVQIMGHGYVLGCPEDGEERLNQAVAKVDEAMCKIRDAGKIKARDRIAVLAALNLAFDLTDRPIASGADAPNLSTSQLQSLLQRMDAVLGHDNQLV
jgi:cell division protein ZapA